LKGTEQLHRAGRLDSGLVLLFCLALEIGAMRPLIGLDVLEAAHRVANGVELLARSATMGSAPALWHKELLGRGTGGERSTLHWLKLPGRLASARLAENAGETQRDLRYGVPPNDPHKLQAEASLGQLTRSVRVLQAQRRPMAEAWEPHTAVGSPSNGTHVVLRGS